MTYALNLYCFKLRGSFIAVSLKGLSSSKHVTRLLSLQRHQHCHAVAFRMYDLDNTGYIERDEVQRFLVALLKDNPAIDLDDAQLNAIIDQVVFSSLKLHLFSSLH